MVEYWLDRANEVFMEALEDYEWRRWVQSDNWERVISKDIDNGKYVFHPASGRYVLAGPTASSPSQYRESNG